MWRVGLVGLLVARVASADCEVAGTPPISVEVVGTTATLTFDGRTRVIHAKTCDELAKSVAVVIEMVLSAMKAAAPEPAPIVIDPDPARTPPAVDETPVPPNTSAPPIAIEPPAVDEVLVPPIVAAKPITIDPLAAPAIAARAEIERRGDVEHDAMASFGTSTSLGAALTLGLRSRWSSVSIAGELEGELPTDIAMNAGVSIVRASIALVPCKHVGAFAACAVARLGFDRGSGADLMHARSAYEPRAELGARLAWEQAVTEHLALQLRGELDLAATISQFDVDNAAVWRSNRFAGLAGVGVIVRFP